MSAQPQEPGPHLRVVPSTGEILDHEDLQRQIAGLKADLEKAVKDRDLAERDLRGKRLTIAKLLADAEADRMEYPRRAGVIRVYELWQRECGHPQARLTADRFDAVRRLMDVQVPAPYPWAAFVAAVAGAKLDAFRTRRKNGTWQVHNDLELICRNGAKFEEFVRKAPAGHWQLPAGRVEQ